MAVPLQPITDALTALSTFLTGESTRLTSTYNTQLAAVNAQLAAIVTAQGLLIDTTTTGGAGIIDALLNALTTAGVDTSILQLP
jgi:hypothetical protein